MSSVYKDITIPLMGINVPPKTDSVGTSRPSIDEPAAEISLTKCQYPGNSTVQSTSSFQDVSDRFLTAEKTDSNSSNSDIDGAQASCSFQQVEQETFQLKEPSCKIQKFDASCHDAELPSDSEPSTSQFMETCDEVMETLFQNFSSLDHPHSASSGVASPLYGDGGEEPTDLCGDSSSECESRERILEMIFFNMSKKTLLSHWTILQC